MKKKPQPKGPEVRNQGGHPQRINVKEERAGEEWRPKGGEVFVYSMVNDISDSDSSPDLSEEAQGIGYMAFLAMRDAREMVTKSGTPVTTAAIVEMALKSASMANIVGVPVGELPPGSIGHNEPRESESH